MQSISAAPPHEQSVLRYALERHALERPDAVYAAFEDEPDWTFRCTLDKVRSTANGLAALNVGRGDTVLLMLGNGGFALRVMFALHYLGAIAVPVNTANTRLNVSFSGEPSRDEPGNYWILDYAPDYSWAIVGDPNGTSGSILTRQQVIPEAEYNALVARAYRLGVKGTITPTAQFPAIPPV